jgi:hypothetical protein
MGGIGTLHQSGAAVHFSGSYPADLPSETNAAAGDIG